jgi:general secretion pathway protein G
MRHFTRRTKKNRGFTLLELVVVMTIIAILASAVGLEVFKYVKHARRARAVQDISTIKTALGAYAIHNGAPPSQDQNLAALMSKPGGAPEPLNWQGPYLEKMPKDPWGHDYVYQVDGNGAYHVLSYGYDNQPGGEGPDNADVTEDEKQ